MAIKPTRSYEMCTNSYDPTYGNSCTSCGSLDVRTCSACGALIDDAAWEQHEQFHVDIEGSR